MDKVQALQQAVSQLATDVASLSAAGLIPASLLDPITASVTALDSQVKALLPTA
jgi:hypothetical protein